MTGMIDYLIISLYLSLYILQMNIWDLIVMNTLPLDFFLTLSVTIPESHFNIAGTETPQVRNRVRVLPVL